MSYILHIIDSLSSPHYCHSFCTVYPVFSFQFAAAHKSQHVARFDRQIKHTLTSPWQGGKPLLVSSCDSFWHFAFDCRTQWQLTHKMKMPTFNSPVTLQLVFDSQLQLRPWLGLKGGNGCRRGVQLIEIQSFCSNFMSLAFLFFLSVFFFFCSAHFSV